MNDTSVDMSVLAGKFDNLVSRLQREIMFKGLKAGGEKLQDYTRQSLQNKFPKASSAKGKSKKTMVESVHVIQEKAYNEVIVSVMNYLTKWYETGTDERYLKEDHPKDSKHHKTYKKGESRGKIKPLHYFREARNNHEDDVVETIKDVIIKELKNEFDNM